MPRLVLVRHGRAAAAWDADLDPGLDDVGRDQARAMAAVLGSNGPLPVVVSPLRRTRETAAALEQVWDTSARVDPAVGEIPSPTDDLGERGGWLRRIMQGRWDVLDADLRQWRAGALAALHNIDTDSVVVTHFVAINVAVGAATGDDRLVCFGPDYCSRTTIDVADGKITVVELGAQAQTIVK